MKLIRAQQAKEAVELIPRLSAGEVDAVEATVRQILAEIRSEGDKALVRWVRKFDWPIEDVADLRAKPEEFEAAERAVPAQLKAAFEQAAERIRRYQAKVAGHSWIEEFEPGVRLGQRVTALHRVGIYAPGGLAAYPSTVLMTALPAQVAGVEELAVATPPDKQGRLKPEVLFACRLCGVEEVYKVGGAQAIAALAYGTESLPPVDKIVGPGSLVVTLAKRLVYGQVGLDGLAGPTELVIIADGEAPVEFIASDVLSQAEHSPDARCTVLLDSEKPVEPLMEALERQLKALSRAEIARESLERLGAVVVVPDLKCACEISDMLAPEHLELAVKEPERLLEHVHNAGAVFLGYYTPEAVGDYWAGPSHVLPTVRTARFTSALSAADFQKRTSVIEYDEAALEKAAEGIAALAECEGFDAHAKSALRRQRRGQ